MSLFRRAQAPELSSESRFPGAPPGGGNIGDHQRGMSRGLPGARPAAQPVSNMVHSTPSYQPAYQPAYQPGYGAPQSTSFTPPRARQQAQPLHGKSLASFFFWAMFSVSACIGYLWTYNQTDVVASQILEQQLLIGEIENTNTELQVIIDQLSKIDRITNMARSELGMVSPAPESLIVYMPDMAK